MKVSKQKRDYKAEYKRRIERGLARGLTLSQARGHPKAKENHIGKPRPIPDNVIQISLKELRSGKSLTAIAKEVRISPERLRNQIKAKGAIRKKNNRWAIPAVSIECKTYLDKTMLQDASTAAGQLKSKNSNAMSIVVAEWLKLTDAVNLKKFKIDQIYVLRKQKNTDREFRYRDGYVKNPIYDEVILHLFETVREYLSTPWEGGISHGLDRGYLI